MTTSCLFAYYTVDRQVSLFSCMSIKTGFLFFLTFCCVVTPNSGVKNIVFKSRNLMWTLPLNDVLHDWRIESLLIDWLILYCIVIGWHIFEFTLISNRVLLLQKTWISKEQRISLAIVYPSFIFCEFQLVYCAEFYKWCPMRDGKILWKIVERSMWFDVSFDLLLNCWHFGLFCYLRCWVWGFVLFWLTLFDWSHGGEGFVET